MRFRASNFRATIAMAPLVWSASQTASYLFCRAKYCGDLRSSDIAIAVDRLIAPPLIIITLPHPTVIMSYYMLRHTTCNQVLYKHTACLTCTVQSLPLMVLFYTAECTDSKCSSILFFTACRMLRHQKNLMFYCPKPKLALLLFIARGEGQSMR